MRISLFKKGLVIGILFLFIGAIVLPVTGTISVRKTSNIMSKGDTFYVGGSGPGNYSKIQDAIDNTSDGDTVFVYDDSSPYYESLQINTLINLKTFIFSKPITSKI